MKFLEVILNKFRNLSKSKDKSYLVGFGVQDPHFTQKYITSLSITEISDKIRENKRDTYNLLSFYFMIFLTLFIGIFLPKKDWIGVLIFGIFLMSIFIPRAISFYKRRFDLADKRDKTLKIAKEMGILKNQIK